MKLIKMFGLAAIAALMAMAFAGAGSAMAESTALCNEDPGTGAAEKCPPESGGKKLVLTHVQENSVGKAKLLTTFLTVECDVSFLGDTVGELNAPLVVKGKFTYTNCGSCTVEEKPKTEAKLEVLKLGHELADVTGEGEVHVVCGTSLDCTYDGTGLKGHALGPLLSAKENAKKEIEFANGEVSVEEQPTNKVAGGLLCPKTSKLDLLTTPSVKTYLTK